MSVRNSTGFELSNLLRLRQPRSTASQNDLGNTPRGEGQADLLSSNSNLQSTLLQLPFGLEPMFLVMALFLSPRHPNLVGLCPDCLARRGRFLGF